MKKLSLFFGVLSISLNLYADSNTSGSLGLLQPSTNTVDKNRSWADKLNTNFQIIDSTVTTTINRINTLAVDTPTIVNNVIISTTLLFNQESPNISERTYYVHNETSGTASLYRTIMSSPSVDAEVSRTVNITLAANLVRISSHVTLNNDPGVRKLPAGVWSFTSWAQVASIANAGQLIVTVSTLEFDGSGQTEILSSTSTNFLDIGVERFDMVAVQQNDIAVSTSIRILVQYFGKSASVLGTNFTLYYAGTTRFTHLTTPIGNFYKLTQLADWPPTFLGKRTNYLAVNNDETALVLVSSSIGGGGASGRDYDLFIGTQGAVGMDAVVTNLASFNLALASVNLNGLTNTSTTTARVFMQSGIYQITGATIPRGLDLVMGSSAVWQAVNGTNTLVTVYGKMRSPKFDLGGTGIASELIKVANNGQLLDFQIYNATGQANQAVAAVPYLYCILCVKGSSNVVIQGDFFDFKMLSPTGGNDGIDSNFKIYDSSYVDIRMNVRPSIIGNSSAVFLHTLRSDNITWHDSFISNSGGDFIDLGSRTSNFYLERNRIVISNSAGDTGFVQFDNRVDATLPWTSSATISLSHNNFVIDTIATAASNIFHLGANGLNAAVYGVRIKGNNVETSGNALKVGGVSAWNFVTTTAKTNGAILQMNTVDGPFTFISDSGTGTIYATSHGNVLNGVVQ